MDTSPDRSWSCYPDGLLPSRRAFFKSLAAAAVAAGTSFLSRAEAEEGLPTGAPLPDFPPGGFP
jgi:hypothetical protein